MITVRLYATLASNAVGGDGLPPAPAAFEVQARPGLKVRDVLAEKDVPAREVCVVTLNNTLADLDSPVRDGDRLGVFPALSGG